MKQFENNHILFLFFYYCEMENMDGLTDFFLLLLSLFFCGKLRLSEID